MIAVSNRIEGVHEYYFSQKLREIDHMNRTGEAVINLGIGSPDLPPHPEVIEILKTEAAKPTVHAYQNYKGIPLLRAAIAGWYSQWFGVTLDPEKEILPLIGSKEGIMHLCMTYLNPGDLALVPDPGYPTYRSAVKLAGAGCLDYSLSEENAWAPDFRKIEQNDLSRVKLMWVNYPHMPTGQLPTKKVFEELIAFGKKHGILICHDNPYSFILNDRPSSILSLPGAMETCVELNSLSKSHNMAGWRVGMLCASAEKIEAVLRFKSNMDSGMFQPLQTAAAHALKLGPDWYDQLNQVYKKRREKVFQLLEQLQCSFSKNQAGLFVWAQIPAGFRNGYELSDSVLKNSRVFITPGAIFGSAGERYIRVSLCATEEKMEEAIKRTGGN